MLRRAMVPVVVCGLTVGVAGACAVARKPDVDLLPEPGVSASVPASGPVAPSHGPHRYRPGVASAGDPLAPGAGNGGYDVAHYALSIEYLPTSRMLTGDETAVAFATQDLSSFDLDLHGLRVSAVQVDGVAAAWRRSGDELVVTPARGIDVGTRFTVRVRYGGSPSSYVDGDLGREGFLPSGPGAIAQGEPRSAASWFAVNDCPTDKATYEISVSTPPELTALSNGLLAGRSPGPDGTVTWRWVENQPMASYLATVMIGDYRIVTARDEGRPAVMAVDASLPTSYDAVLNRTPEVVDFLETQFGPYPFDAEGGVIHADSRVKFALENQSRPVYPSGFFARGAGPDGSGPKVDASWVLAHELTHQWFGDSVSVRSWSDVWLNEGFATYGQWLWGQHEGGASPRQIFDALYQGRDGQALPSEPPASATVLTEADMFGESVYTRGAAVLEALRIAVGDETFFSIVRGWAASRRYGNASTGDFIAYAEGVAAGAGRGGMALDALLRDWLFTVGKPAYPQPVG